MQLSEHFTTAEFTASETAVRHGLDNSLPATMLATAASTCEMLERIRAKLSELAGREVPIQVTSGYRCARVNALVGSSSSSDHIRAMAIDFKAPAFGSPYEIAQALAPLVDELEIGQLIHEFGQWVHVSTREPERDVNRIITISHAGTQPGVLAV